jgi:MarR family transcriptional regulator, organic hydroperoxide resistance regulator
VKRLERRGLVARNRRQTDERQVEVKLTEAGHALLLRSNCLNESLLKSLSMTRKQIQVLNEQIKSVRKALNGGRFGAKRASTPARDAAEVHE